MSGTSVGAFMRCDGDRFLAAEPNPKFLSILQPNWGSDHCVTAVDTLCLSVVSTDTFRILESNGPPLFWMELDLAARTAPA